jgi:hypothetical protein
MFSTRQSNLKKNHMSEIQILVEVIQVVPVVMGDQERKQQGNELWSCFVAVQWQITFSQADNIGPWQITHVDFGGFMSHFKCI